MQLMLRYVANHNMIEVCYFDSSLCGTSYLVYFDIVKNRCGKKLDLHSDK